MKRIKNGEVFNVKLKIAKDFHWKVFGQLCRDLGLSGWHAQKMRGCIRNRDTKGLFSLLPDLGPRRILERTGMSEKSDAFDFFRQYQLGAFLKKFPFRGEDTKTPAVRKFVEAEHQCALFNNENYKGLVRLNEIHPEFLGVLDEMREDILSLLGELPPIDSIIGHAKHGPGVSLGDQYADGKSTSFYKWSALPYTVTAGTLEIARLAISSDPRWIGALDDWYRSKERIPIGAPIDINLFWDSVFLVVDGSRITTVPKTAETDRTIAIEPLLNVYLQLGVDHVIKAALRKQWGYDLSQQSRNQIYAEEASVTNKMVTVDLKAASDTISLILCWLLLPPAWMDLLFDLRSPQGELEGETYRFEKISSMGNGFTFALESLIFGALVRCAIKRTKSVKKSAVYGDDLIVPTTAYPFLQALLSLCGFKVNEDKTFVDGPFRESCGKDFFLGYDVRPVFLKRQVQNVQDLFYIHNALWKLQERLHWTWDVDLSKTLQLIKAQLPLQVRLFFVGPPGESDDTHLFSHEKLGKTLFGNDFHWQLIAKPKKYISGRKTFLFRRLMCQLRPKPDPFSWKWWMVELNTEYKWDRERRMDTGNAFDITRRDVVDLYYVKHELVYDGSCDQKPLSACTLRN